MRGEVRRAISALLWLFWYRVFRPLPPKGKGDRQNPLTIEDMKPLQTALRRISPHPSALSGGFIDEEGGE